MDQRSGQKRAVEYLYPPIDPFDQRVIDMGDGHRIYVEQCGNPDGIPVIVLARRPRRRLQPGDAALFRPRRVPRRAVRPARLRPLAPARQRRRQHHLAPGRRYRDDPHARLGIDRFIVFGGSWGATLALIYAITHPDRVAHLVLRGVFL